MKKRPADLQRCAASGRRRRATALGALLLLGTCRLAGAAVADDGAEVRDLHLSGFGTLGLAQVNAPAGMGFRRDMGERPNDGGTRADIDTRLGAQANYRASSQIEFVGQVLGANRVAHEHPSDFVTLAFAAWRPRDDVTLRVGRLSADYYLLADYRNVGFAYPFVRPPVETYASLPYALDGADLTKAWHVDETVWKLRGIAGRSRSYSDLPGSTFALRPVFSLVASREDGDGLLLKASASRVRLRSEGTSPQPLLDALRPLGALPAPEVTAQAASYADAVDADGRWVSYYALGASLERGAWLVGLEVSRCQNSEHPYSTAWANIGHRWGALTTYGGWSAVRTQQSRTPPQWAPALTPLIGAAAAAQAQQLGNIAFAAASSTNASQRTVMLGLRWDMSDRTALKLQWDHVRVDAYGARIWSLQPTPEAIHANVGSVTFDFVF